MFDLKLIFIFQFGTIEFFLSINMTALPTDFWLESVLEKPPPERQILCQPSAWDFCNSETYR